MKDQCKYKISEIKQNWKERGYHVYDYADDGHKYVKMCFSTNQFSSLSFCGPHTEPHGVRGLSKHYHMLFDPNLRHGTLSLIRIHCACAECTYII